MRSYRPKGLSREFRPQHQVSPEVETHWVAETDERQQQVRAEGEDRRKGEMKHWMKTKEAKNPQKMTDEESWRNLV